MSGLIRVVAAVVVSEGRVLATRRPPNKQHGGLWEFPGGKVEPGESDEAALVRELQEELALSVTVGRCLGTFFRPPIALVAWACAPVTPPGTPVTIELREHTEARWLTSEELGSVAWAPADLDLIAQLQQGALLA